MSQNPHVQLGMAVLVALLLGVLLLALKPKNRATIRNLLVGLLLLGALLLAAHLLQAVPAERASMVLRVIVLIGVGAVLIRFGCLFVFTSLLPRLRVDLPRIAEDLAFTGLFVAWLIYGLHGAGLDLGSLLATSAVITAVLAFSMQDTLGNVLGGVVLQLDDSLRVGDWVRIDNISGRVVDVRWRHTAVETRDRETVIIPNGWMVKNRFTVIGSRRDPQLRWRRWVWFNLSLDTPPSEVISTLEDCVADSGVPHVVLDPRPSAVLMEVGQGYARYALRFWICEAQPDDPSDSAIRQHALAALARRGIGLAVVTEERLVIKENERRRASLAADEIKRRKRLLSEVDLFSSLSDEELTELASHLVTAPYPKGSTITRQGRVAHWLYLIVSGNADVWMEQDGERTHLATLMPGSVVGEMGMMTGDARRATVTARTDVACLRLGKIAFQSILRARPEIASEISSVISAREGQLDLARQAAASRNENQVHREALGARIRAFFGLDE
ncbi:MAG: mechanosensitive ion channel [Xanthomonadales bacterium]|nr:mechanosensitive ion channel [Xanthomonadales bacterium]